MRLTDLLFATLIASVSALPEAQQQDCSKCPDKGMGQGALWSGKDYTGDCVCFEALNHCTNLADIGFNDRAISLKQHQLSGTGCVYYLHGDCGEGPRKWSHLYVRSSNDPESVIRNDLGAPREYKFADQTIDKHALTDMDKTDEPGFKTHGDTWADNISSVYCYDNMDDFEQL